MGDRKIVFAGAMGAGKTTVIRALSEIEPVSTEVANRQQGGVQKESTTVALDYGEINVGNGERLRLYGTPGQERFAFMWRILARGALGVVVLVDHSQPDPIAATLQYLNYFSELRQDIPFVIGVGRIAQVSSPGLEGYIQALADAGWRCPVLAVDVRRREDALVLLDVLLSMAESAA